MKLTDDSRVKENLADSQASFSINTGNLNFIAPEILKKQNHNEECDLWSLGVIIYILAFKETPFQADNETELLILYFPYLILSYFSNKEIR